MRALLIALLVSAGSQSVAADPASEKPWYAGTAGRTRLLHLGITTAFGVTYMASETVLKPTLAGSRCRWCEPPGFDRSVRDAVVWNDTGRAATLSTLDAYVLAPIVGFGFLVASDYDAGLGRLLDDTIPVAEAIAISQSFTQLLKFTARRQRPFVHFADPGRTPSTDDNTSFTSGHSALGFSITAGAGIICHWRHYWTEPYVWGAGIALSVSTEYLRMGADKHYLSDVVAGGGIGLAAGLLVPRLMRNGVNIVPITNGAAVVGMF